MSHDSFELRDCVHVQGNPWRLHFPVLGVAFVLFELLTGHPLWEATLWLLALSPFAAGMVYNVTWSPRLRPLDVRADAKGVTLGDRFIPRRRIREGLVLAGDPPTVELHLRGLRLPVRLRMGADDGSVLLRVLCLDPPPKVALFRAAPGAQFELRVLAFTMMALLASLAVMVTTKRSLNNLDMMLVSALAVALRFVSGPRVAVGADGIAMGRLWRRRRRWRFLGFDGLTSVTRYETGKRGVDGHAIGLRLLQGSGEEMVLPFADETELTRAQVRIGEAMDTFRDRSGDGGGPYRRAPAADRSAPLRRGGRELGLWVTALRALVRSEEAATTVTVSKERLLRIVEDPAAEAVDRVASAVALGAALDPEGRSRLRAAIEAVAAPRLRVALEKAAGAESEAESEAALADLGEDEPRAEGQRGP